MEFCLYQGLDPSSAVTSSIHVHQDPCKIPATSNAGIAENDVMLILGLCLLFERFMCICMYVTVPQILAGFKSLIEFLFLSLEWTWMSWVSVGTCFLNSYFLKLFRLNLTCSLFFLLQGTHMFQPFGSSTLPLIFYAIWKAADSCWRN